MNKNALGESSDPPMGFFEKRLPIGAALRRCVWPPLRRGTGHCSRRVGGSPSDAPPGRDGQPDPWMVCHLRVIILYPRLDHTHTKRQGE